MFLGQNAYINLAFTPIDINAAARTGIRVDTSGYDWAWFLGTTQDSAAAVTYTFNRHTAVSGGTSEVLDVLETTTAARSTVWKKEATTDAGILTADAWTQVVATSASTVAVTAGSGAQVLVGFKSDWINGTATSTAGMRWVSADTSAPGNACICAGFWILTSARFAQNNLSVTLP